MFKDLRARMRAHYEYVRERDRRWLLAIPVTQLDRYILPLLGPYLVLNFLDVATTLAAMRYPAFHELNPIAAALFHEQFAGFALALAIKYSPAVVLTVIAIVKDRNNSHPIAIRTLKLSSLAVLVAGNIFYVYVVGSNLGNLFRLLF